MPPTIRCEAVLSGTIAWSSRLVVESEPAEVNTPMTWYGHPVDRHGLPDRVERAEQFAGGVGREHRHRRGAATRPRCR